MSTPHVPVTYPGSGTNPGGLTFPGWGTWFPGMPSPSPSGARPSVPAAAVLPSQIETIEIGTYDEVPVAAILKNMIFMGIATNINDPNRISFTGDAFQDHAVLTVPVLHGPQGDPGDDAITTRFQNKPITELNELPTDLGDYEGDLGKFWVYPVVDRVTGEAIATTIYVWTGIPNGAFSGHPGLGQGFVQIPVGTPGPPGVYPDIDPSLVITEPGSGLGPYDRDSWVSVNPSSPAENPAMTFNLAVPNGETGPSSPLGGFIDIDLKSTSANQGSMFGTGPTVSDVLVCTSRVTPGPPTGLTAVASTTGGALPAHTYYYVVTSTLPNGESVASNEVSVITTGSTSSVSLSWTPPPLNNATGYNIYRGTSAGNENVLVRVVSSSTTVSTVDVGGLVTSDTPPTVGMPTGLPVWVNQPQVKASPYIYTFPESAFGHGLSIGFLPGLLSPSEITVGIFSLPQQPWPWVPMVFGSIVVDGLSISLTPLQAQAHIRLGSASTGQIVGSATAGSFGTMTVVPDLTSTAVDPLHPGRAVVPAYHTGNLGTLYFNLVELGLLDIFTYNQGKNAQLTVLVIPLVSGVTSVGAPVPDTNVFMNAPSVSSSVTITAPTSTNVVMMPPPIPAIH